MANLQLNQYISDKWYDIYRSNIDTYIAHFGQDVRLLKRTETTYNQYSDIIRDVAIAPTVPAIISKNPFENYFFGPPLAYENEPTISEGYFAYFTRGCLVRTDDIIIIEFKSIEGDVTLEAFEVVAIKGKRLEQEFIRRYFLSPIRDSNQMFKDNSILTTDEVIQDYSAEHEVDKDPGGWSENYYTNEIKFPGTEGFIDTQKELEVNKGPYEEISKNLYNTDFPEKWLEGQPYDIGKPIK